MLHQMPAWIQYVVAPTLAYCFTNVMCKMGDLLYKRHEEKVADEYSMKKGNIAGLYCHPTLRRLQNRIQLGEIIEEAPLEQKVGIKYLICKLAYRYPALDRFMEFLMDPYHPSNLARIRNAEEYLAQLPEATRNVHRNRISRIYEHWDCLKLKKNV